MQPYTMRTDNFLKISCETHFGINSSKTDPIIFYVLDVVKVLARLTLPSLTTGFDQKQEMVVDTLKICYGEIACSCENCLD